MTISIKTRNLEEIRQMITDLPRSIRGEATMEASKYLIGNERRGLQYYPAPRPSSKYRRTYVLRFGWQVNSWDAGARTQVKNDVPYAPYVQGDNEQAWFHRGIWRTTSQIIEDNINGINAAIERVADKWIKDHEIK